MDDLFSEVLIKKKPTAGNIALKYLPVGAGVVCLLCGVLLHTVFLLPGAVLLILGIWLMPRQDIEYEYSYVNGALDIDCIYGKRSRKHKASYDLSQMEIMAPAGSPFLDGTAGLKNVDYTSGDAADSGSVYAVVIPHGGERQILLLQPSESMKKDLRMRMPSRVHL